MSSLNTTQQLEKQAAIYVKNLVDEFKENPASRRFDNIIPPPRTGKNIKIFLSQDFYMVPHRSLRSRSDVSRTWVFLQDWMFYGRSRNEKT